MAKHYIKAAKPKPEKPRAEIRAAKSFYEKTHPVGSAERFLDEAAKEALAATAAGGVITPKGAVIGAVKAVADEMDKYPDPLLAEAAKLSRDELAKRAARAAIHQRAMEAQNAAVRVASVLNSPVGNMTANNAALTADEVLGTRQDADGGYAGGRNTVSRVEARNTTKRERERVAAIEAALREERRPKLEARVEPSEPRMTREQARELMSGRGGQGDPDAMLGERMNPLTTAAMMSLGLPESAVQTLAAAGMTTVTMAGLEGLREDRPKTAGLLNLALTAASLPGLAAAARRSFVRAVNDVLAEPTEAKLNLLYEMTKAAAERKQGGAPGAPGARITEGLQNLLTAKESPKQLDWQGPRKQLDWQGPRIPPATQKRGPQRLMSTGQGRRPQRSAPNPQNQGSGRPSHAFYALDDAAKEDLLIRYLEALDDFVDGNTSYRGFGPANQEGILGSRLRSVGEQIPPEVRDFIDGQLANYNGNAHNFFRELMNDERFTGFWDWMGRGSRLPLPKESGPVWTIDNTGGLSVKASRWYADLVQRYGEKRAQAMAQFVSSSDYPDYFLPPGPDGQTALDEIRQYASTHKIIRDVTEPGEIVIGGSAGINLEGTISRETAVPHDLDFSGYIANASRRTDIPFYLNDGKPLSPRVRNEMYAALSNRENIENAPIIQKLRRLYPELKDAGFRYARYDWEFSGGTQYKPGVFTIVKRPDITKKGNGTLLLTTKIDGNNVDIMLTDAKIMPNPIDPRYGSADVAFDWKDYYGWRSKDLRDKADFSRFSQDNPISSAVSGRARFSPSRFADSLITDEGFPVVVDVEQTPGGPTVPMVMNHRGVMLQADDPSLLSMYAKNNPVNSPRFAGPADASSKPLAAARVIHRIARNQGAQGEAAPSIGVYRADDLQKLADHLIQWAGTSDDIVVYRNGATVDPAANLANVLYTENGVTGGPFSFWPAKTDSNYNSSGRLRNRNQDLITRALENPTPENLKELGQAFGEATRGSEPLVDRVDNRLRNVLYSRSTGHYAEAKPGRYVPDTEATGVFHASDPGLRDKLIKALGDSRFALPFLVAAGLAEGPAESGDPQPAGTNQDSKGGNTRTDAKGGDTPGSPLGAPVPVGPAPAQSGGPRIVINPQVFSDKRDALCVAFNEAFRIVMEDNAFDPVSEPTEKQRRFFADTAYADDEVQLRRTILARIATLDTSVSDPTDEQLQETAEMLEMVMEVGAPQNDWEQTCVKRLLDVVSASLNGTKNPGNPVDREPPGIV